ncbi:hypothetical protein B0H10DRAFT_2194572 [Mycena sp. CBHHK59/15]|nr:hypothetical protein B0H10DRAFT_2194572 [Mycena sp. CBHHK59/15]
MPGPPPGGCLRKYYGIDLTLASVLALLSSGAVLVIPQGDEGSQASDSRTNGILGSGVMCGTTLGPIRPGAVKPGPIGPEAVKGTCRCQARPNWAWGCQRRVPQAHSQAPIPPCFSSFALVCHAGGRCMVQLEIIDEPLRRRPKKVPPEPQEIQ